MAPTLEQVFTLRIYRTKDDTLSFGPTKGGAPRFISPLTGGYLRSAGQDDQGIDAKFVQGGSDWLTVDPSTATGHLDARVHFRSDNADTDVFYVHFTGLVVMDEKIAPIMAWSAEAATTQSRDHYAFMQPLFEVSNVKHKWMETTAFVGHGHYVVEHGGDGQQRQAVEYEIYKLVTG